LATLCDHFLASFGEQFGYTIFRHLATLVRYESANQANSAFHPFGVGK